MWCSSDIAVPVIWILCCTCHTLFLLGGWSFGFEAAPLLPLFFAFVISPFMILYTILFYFLVFHFRFISISDFYVYSCMFKYFNIIVHLFITFPQALVHRCAYFAAYVFSSAWVSDRTVTDYMFGAGRCLFKLLLLKCKIFDWRSFGQRAGPGGKEPCEKEHCPCERAGQEQFTPNHSKDPSPTIWTYRKKEEKGKTVEEKKGASCLWQ